jgi:hypothetical protein
LDSWDLGGAIHIGRLRQLPRKWLIAVALLGLLLCAASIPIIGGLGWIVGVTLDAGKGAACAECAVMRYLANHPISELRDDLAYNHVLCSQRRKELTSQDKAFAATYRQAAERHQHTVALSLNPWTRSEC